MDAIAKIRERARKKIKSVVLPEYDDKRVVEAARIVEAEGLAKATLFTEDMVDKQEKERYIQEYYEMYKSKDIDLATVEKLFEEVLYYTAMMTREGKFDGLVAGAAHTTPDMVRASMRCIGIDERITIISSCFIMDVPNCPYGENGTFVFADCGVIPEPNSRQLACIALSAAELAEKVLDLKRLENVLEGIWSMDELGRPASYLPTKNMGDARGVLSRVLSGDFHMKMLERLKQKIERGEVINAVLKVVVRPGEDFGLLLKALADNAQSEPNILRLEDSDRLEEIFRILIVFPSGGPEDAQRTGLSFPPGWKTIYAGRMNGRFEAYLLDSLDRLMVGHGL